MSTRIGKIGRLPKGVREELGRRIEDGLPGNEIVPWLNGQKEVRECLAQWFEGRAITEQNLSEWRSAGHVEWLRQVEAREASERLAERSEELQAGAMEKNWSDRWAMVVTVEMQRVAAALVEQETDLGKRWERLCGVNKELSALRRDDHRLARVTLQRDQWSLAEDRRQKEEERRANQEQRERLQDMILEQRNKARNAELFGAKEAEMFYRLKFNVPMDDILDGTWEAEEAKLKAAEQAKEAARLAEGKRLKMEDWLKKRKAEMKAKDGEHSTPKVEKAKARGSKSMGRSMAKGKGQRAKEESAKRAMKSQKSKLIQANRGKKKQEAKIEQQSNDGTKGQKIKTEKFADRKMGAEGQMTGQMTNDEWVDLPEAEEKSTGWGQPPDRGESGAVNHAAGDEPGNAPGREAGTPEAEPVHEVQDPGSEVQSQPVVEVSAEVEANGQTSEVRGEQAQEPRLTAREVAYNTWFRMNCGAIPHDEELLKKLNAEAEAEERETMTNGQHGYNGADAWLFRPGGALSNGAVELAAGIGYSEHLL